MTGKRCQTLVIGCISPNERDIQQTINTLRYAEGLRPGLKKDAARAAAAGAAGLAGLTAGAAAGREKEEETLAAQQAAFLREQASAQRARTGKH